LVATTGSGRNGDTEANITLGKGLAVLGEAEWAAIQTVQVAESVALEC